MTEATQVLCDLIVSELEASQGLGRRIVCNAIRRALDKLDPQPVVEKPTAMNLEPLTNHEGNEFGRQIIGYGLHADLPFEEIDDGYLGWLVERKKIDWQQLIRYMKWRNNQQ